MLIRLNRGKYALVSAIPGVFKAVITFWAGYAQMADIYLPNSQYLPASLAILAMPLMAFVFVGAFRKWYRLLGISTEKVDSYGERVKETVS
ncbi:hypothetical protein GCM10007415_02480 [Parapedobacter pyrenivorans]|uniref:Uncharacterized protein n=1 Tax=Parapedobacter pyrenivorans TaxID=1305674 RepID=A0A917HC35_9SPHI|nr:hypothetical protein GCM10007415_02480 [Parapedobacter pyrenivorans]